MTTTKKATVKKAAAKKAPAKKTAAKKPAGTTAVAKKAAARVPANRSAEDREAAVRSAEAAGQRAVVGLGRGEPLPDKLQEALDRRVEINLAATGGHPLVSMAGADPEVVRLEEPWRKLRPATDGEAAIE